MLINSVQCPLKHCVMLKMSSVAMLVLSLVRRKQGHGSDGSQHYSIALDDGGDDRPVNVSHQDINTGWRQC